MSVGLETFRQQRKGRLLNDLWKAKYPTCSIPYCLEKTRRYMKIYPKKNLHYARAYVIEGREGKVCFWPPSFVRPISYNRPTNVSKKSPAQAKKFWGPFFSKIDVFFKNLRFLAVFNGFLALFQCLHNEKARHRRKIWEPLFLRAAKNFPTNFSFASDQIFILVRYPPWKNLAITYAPIMLFMEILSTEITE